MLNKTTFVELNKVQKKKIVLFGSGNVAKKTIRKIGRERISYIADNSTNLQGEQYEEIDIKAPIEIKKGDFVIICSTAISDISEQLKGMGLIDNVDFTISPILNDLLAISDLEQIATEFYFTSGTVPIDKAHSGGGLYHCEVKVDKVSLTKVYSGACYGATKVKDELYFIDTDNGVFKLNKGEIMQMSELPKGSRAHGISYNESNGKFYITGSYLDGAYELDEKFNILRTIKITNKMEITIEPMHHCNDNLSIGNSLYVSMFSSTGNWKFDVFDGCIAEFDLDTGERRKDIFQGLYMPHNVTFFDGSIHVLDSLPGHLRFNNLSIQGTFPAFTRGLDYRNGLYYIGQSKNRNYSKVMGISNNISIDCGVVIFNPELKASRFIQFPHTIGEIHSIIALK
tara:strand:+ start:603 stop:1796 length:1194 start_codon:yes stop_codon:yes gene_type:complete